MRFLLSFLLLILFSVKAISQITGRIIDKINTPIPFVNIMLLDTQSKKLVKGTLTDDEGKYFINNIPLGKYFIKVSLIGYKEEESELFEINNDSFSKKMTDIILKVNINSLEAVSISSTKKQIQQTEEGLIINVQENILTQGSNILQILERSPGIILDQRNNNFSLNGKSGASIMINGKLIRLPISDIISMLSNMSADTVDKIELLTNPSSKYDSDGNAGIINIVFSKNEKIGTYGNLGISTGYGVSPKQTTSISLNHGLEKANIYGSYSFSYDETFSQWRGIGTTELSVFGGKTMIDFTSKTSQLNRSHNFNSGIDYSLNKTSTLGINLFTTITNPQINTNNRGLYNFTSDPFLDTRIQLNSSGNRENHNISSYYELKKEKSSLTLSADAILFTNKSPNTVQSLYFNENGEEFQPENEIYNTGNIGENTTDINIGVLKLDYSSKVNPNLTIETGIKGTLSKTKNIAEIKVLRNDKFIIDNRFINNRKIEEKIGAIYAISKYKLNKKVNIQVGLRYEYWDRFFKNSNLGGSFGKLFPTLFITKKISDTTSFNLAYSKRITRPNFNDLAASLTYNSPTSVFSGNPFLRPAISNSINFSYYYKSNNFSLIFSNEENPIARFQVEENPISDLAVIGPQNLKYQNSIDFQTNIPIKISNYWKINFNGTIGWRQFRVLHTPMPITHDYIHFNFNGNQTIQLPKQFSFELSGWYTSNHFLGSTSTKGFGVINFGVKKDLKNNSSLKFSVSDVFSTFDVYSKIGNLTSEAYNNIFDVKYSSESGISPIFRIGYSKGFGNDKIKKSKIRSSSNEEKSRIN